MDDGATAGWPPPPSGPNVMPDAPPSAAPVRAAPDDLRGLNVCAAIIGVALVFVGFSSGLDRGVAYAIGSGLGSLTVPVILGALIGWGNERRARITFVVFALVFMMLRATAAA